MRFRYPPTSNQFRCLLRGEFLFPSEKIGAFNRIDQVLSLRAGDGRVKRRPLDVKLTLLAGGVDKREEEHAIDEVCTGLPGRHGDLEQ